MAHYRIVTDVYSGYEVQIWRWWWPFWAQAGRVNTHSTVEKAEHYAQMLAETGTGRFVKYLGRLLP